MDNRVFGVLACLVVVAIVAYLYWPRNKKEIQIDDEPEEVIEAKPVNTMPADRESPLVETFPSISNPDWSKVEEKEDPEAEQANYQVDEEMVRDHSIGMSGYLTKEDQAEDRQVTHVTVGDAETAPSDEELESLQTAIDNAPAVSTRFSGKFSDDEVRAIRASTKSNDLLAIQYDCSIRTIQRIKDRETYKHVLDAATA